MSTPPEPNPAPDNTRWTGEKAAAFLKQLARHGKVARAARAVGMSRQAAYRLRARAPKFAELWEIAMADAARARAAARRARKSVHPLLASEVTPPPRNRDTPAQRASQIDRVALQMARARSHMARER
jgi:hypothetical protein